jgi:hypothetical protein
MENDVFSFSIILVVLAGLGYGIFTLMKNRSEQILFKWADENGYQLLDLQHKMIFQGPFGLSSKNQTIFRIAVEDAEGIQRTGWVRCGSFVLGIINDKVEVKWDKITTDFPA